MEDIKTNGFGKDQARTFQEKYKKYNQGKASIDNKATANQEWWRLRHWSVIAGETNEAHKDNPAREVGSAWAINSLLNKHADIMDSFPKPNVLPREADDVEEAKMLSEILPVVLEANDYEGVYRQMGWDFTIDGAAITGVFWDSTKNDGIGDVAITNVDVHNLAWQPGIQDIQESDMVFHATLQDIEAVKQTWPQFADEIGPYNPGTRTEYVHDDNIETQNKTEVIDCYYKKYTTETVVVAGGMNEDGTVSQMVMQVPKEVLHMAIICGDTVLWCSENEEGYENGFYEHGKYPFVVRRHMPIKDSLWGFGYLDIMKNPQKDIDKLDQAIIRNAIQKANNRYWVKKNAAINRDAFADWNEELVELGTGDIKDQVGLIETGNIPSTAMQHLERKIDELKETSGNRDFSQGSTQSGVTAASAIAALQEAGSKLSRDVNKELYRGAREEYYLVIELIRQFYNQPRTFRVKDDSGNQAFVQYDNSNLIARDEMTPGGLVHHKKAMFDIEISAEKQSPFSRAAQNETAKELYSMGLFAPENSVPALVCLNMMEFEGKENIIMQVQQNSTFLQQYQQAMMFIQQLAAQDQQIFMMASQMGVLQEPGMPMGTQVGGTGRMLQGTAEERAARNADGGDNSLAAQARRRAANASNPG